MNNEDYFYSLIYHSKLQKYKVKPIYTDRFKELAHLLNIDEYGLDELDRQLLLAILEKFKGGPVGIDTLAATLSEDRDTLEDMVEPFLMQQGLIMRTPKGRMTTQLAKKYINFQAV